MTSGFAWELARWRPPRGTLGIQPLGHAGFALRGQRALVLIDPFLSDRADRLIPPPDGPDRFVELAAVLATHEHSDHLDLPSWQSLSRASPAARFVAPAPLVERAAAAGVPADRIAGAQPGIELAIEDVRISPVPARHGVTPEDAYTFGTELEEGAVRYLGYVVEIDGIRVYHSGDTIEYPEQADLVRALGARVAMLPINGRDEERESRGVVGNLDACEAARLAVELDVELALPMHHDVIRGNRGDAVAFVRAVRKLSSRTLAVALPPTRRLVWPPAA